MRGGEEPAMRGSLVTALVTGSTGEGTRNWRRTLNKGLDRKLESYGIKFEAKENQKVSYGL